MTRTSGWPSGRLASLHEELAVASDGDRDTEIDVVSPVTGETYVQVPEATATEVATAVETAREASEAWRERDVAERTAVLDEFADRVLAEQSTLRDLVQRETGKSRRDAAEEVFDVAVTAGYYADTAADTLASERRQGAVPGAIRATVHHHPVGVVGLIAPWNYPLTLAISDALPALAAGNGVVCKPAEETTHVALYARRLLVEAGLPPELFQVVSGRGPEVGPPLVEAVDYVSFTGSTAAGRQVAAQAGEQLVPTSMELGGKNPLLVLDDADPEEAARRSVRSCFANAGQLCITTERLYVHEDVYEPFRAAFAEAVGEITLGFDYEWRAEMGPLLSRAQFEKTREHVEDAVANGATVVAGGEPRPDLGPFFHEPTVLEDVTADAVAHETETFGPVVSLYPVESVDEAVARANDTDYGLHGAVWAGDVERGEAVARRLETGTVSVNEGYAAAWASLDAPMGGRGDSGLGRRHGAEGLLRYTAAQTVATGRALQLDPGPVPDRLWAAGLTTVARLLRKVPKWVK
ncbi:succinic semialdehyde dehydrogenase [Halobaculum sp. MBLA0147]|uniref:succinic semialdehyde dehydrogenase n=1 Tax=Halobaculum sp. MBLA0147 TaxID=3079934 RepID=UPI003525D850